MAHEHLTSKYFSFHHSVKKKYSNPEPILNIVDVYYQDALSADEEFAVEVDINDGNTLLLYPSRNNPEVIEVLLKYEE